ncbi:hypothetical protein [Wenzhouxiangella limi]|uniref:Uncharacterized protein n=1 Tax=Wenzhouxiangella limi TaxID=2707351 RepID=A0A845USS6_9GAMM|nr:hypothetical protein [Wenzhouxiangella limi]NDY94883.1 hypothetical protein [Wenzhouxiangella limi]
MIFKTDQQGIVLDPNPRIGHKSRVEYRRPISEGARQPDANKIATSFIVNILENDIGLGVPGWLIDVANEVGDFFGLSVEPTFRFGLLGDVGGYFEVNSVGKSGLKIDYPLTVPITLPAPNTFACGDFVDVSTTRVNGNPWMEVEPAFYNLEVGPIADDLRIGVEIGLSVSVCLGVDLPGVGCAGKRRRFNSGLQSLTLLDLPDLSLPALLNFCEDAFEEGADVATLLGCTAPGGTRTLLQVAQTLIENNSIAKTIATFEPGKVTIATPDLPTNPVSLPEVAGEFRDVRSGALSFNAEDGGDRLKVSGATDDIAEVGFDLVSLIDVATGVPTSLSLGSGLGSLDLGDIAPTLSVNQRTHYQFDALPEFDAVLDTEMEWQVFSAEGALVASGFGKVIRMSPGERLQVRYPQALQDPTGVANIFELAGPFTTQSQQDYIQSLEARALQLNVPGLVNETLLELDLGKSQIPGSPKKIEHHRFELESFNISSQTPFFLDPEKPILDIVRFDVTDSLNLGRGERGIVYRLDVSNGGDVVLNQLQIFRDFSETFGSAQSFEVLCVDSPDLEKNETFDGNEDTNLLAQGNTMEIGQQSTIKMLVKVKPEVSEVLEDGCFGTVDYFATSSATGVSPIGTAVTDGFDQCTQTNRSDPIVSPVDLGAAVIDELSDFTVYGWEGVDLARSLGLSAGNLGTGKDLQVLPYRGKPSEDLRIIGDLHIARDLQITQSVLEADYLQLGRNFRGNGRGTNLILNGAKSVGSMCVSTFDKPSVSSANIRRAPKIEVKEGTEINLPPGQYEEVMVERGGLLILSAGIYDVGSLRIEGDGAIVNFDVALGPINLNLNEWLMLPVRDLAFLVENGSTRDVLIDYSGRKPQIFRSSLVQATILAPLASLNFDEGTRLEGAVYANRVKFGPASSFSGHRFQEPLQIDPVCQAVLNPAN